MRSATASAPPGFGLAVSKSPAVFKKDTPPALPPKKEAPPAQRTSTQAALKESGERAAPSDGSTRTSMGSKRHSMRGTLERSKTLLKSFGKKKTRTVVCVDADMGTLDALSKILEELRFFPMAFTSSVEAKDFIVEHAPSGTVVLVIASMVMTGVSGMQLLQDIRAMRVDLQHDVPFMLLSSFSKGNGKVSDFQIKAGDGSVVDIVLKPLVSGVVVRKVRELTGRDYGDAKRREPKVADATSPQQDRKKPAVSPQFDRLPPSEEHRKLSSERRKTISSTSVNSNLDRLSIAEQTGAASPVMSNRNSTSPHMPLQRTVTSPAMTPALNRGSTSPAVARPSFDTGEDMVTPPMPRAPSLVAIPGASGNKLSASRDSSSSSEFSSSPVRATRSKTMTGTPKRDTDNGTSKSGGKKEAVEVEESSPQLSAIPRSQSTESAFLDTAFNFNGGLSGPRDLELNWDDLDAPDPATDRRARRKTLTGSSVLSKKKI